MTTNRAIPPRHSPSYRSREFDFIVSHARRGESLCLVGVAGSGKSNLIVFLSNSEVMGRQIEGKTPKRIYFPAVDATGWDGTAESLWRIHAIGLAGDHESRVAGDRHLPCRPDA